MQIAKKQARTTSKYAITKYTQAFSTSNITASQRTKTIFFLIVPPQYYWPLLHVCGFLYSLIVPSIRRWRIDFKIIELVVCEMTNMHEVPARTRKSRKIRIVAGRRFWRFLLVNQLPLSIMAVHAQYRATAPLKSITANSRVCLFVEGRGYFLECRGYIVEGPYLTLKNVWKSVKRINIKFAHRVFSISVFVLIRV